MIRTKSRRLVESKGKREEATNTIGHTVKRADHTTTRKTAYTGSKELAGAMVLLNNRFSRQEQPLAPTHPRALVVA